MPTGMTAIKRAIFLHDVLRGGRPLSERRRSHGPRVGWPKLHIRKCEDMSAWPPWSVSPRTGGARVVWSQHKRPADRQPT